jgi:hypothetical protein
VSIKKAFTAFAASYFVLVFLKDGTMVKLVQDASRGAQDLAKGAKRLTNIT